MFTCTCAWHYFHIHMYISTSLLGNTSKILYRLLNWKENFLVENNNRNFFIFTLIYQVTHCTITVALNLPELSNQTDKCFTIILFLGLRSKKIQVYGSIVHCTNNSWYHFRVKIVLLRLSIFISCGLYMHFDLVGNQQTVSSVCDRGICQRCERGLQDILYPCGRRHVRGLYRKLEHSVTTYHIT